MLTFLKYARPVDLEDARIVLVFLVETHLGGSVAPYRSNIKRGGGNGKGRCCLPLLAWHSGAVVVSENTLHFSRFQCLGKSFVRGERNYFDA
jgi:hypothetical protein